MDRLDSIEVQRSLKSGSPTSADQVDDQDDDRQNQKNVDEPAHGVGADESEKPENQQDYENCPKHRETSNVSVLALEAFRHPNGCSGT